MTQTYDLTGNTIVADAVTTTTGGTSGVLVTTATTAGFFGATPVVQQSTTGTTTGFTAGSGTAVNDDSTFTGGTGTKAYRISDIVKALKAYGILASS